MGGQPRSEVLRYDGRSFVPYLGGASATDLAFSADGQRVAYVSVPEGTLWSSKIDGSDRIQLSDPSVMEAALPRWSPDGTQIVFMARTLNTDWRAYLVAANGHGLRELIPGATAGFDPGWSPDGKSIVLAVGDLGATSNKISILDREDGEGFPRSGRRKPVFAALVSRRTLHRGDHDGLSSADALRSHHSTMDGAGADGHRISELVA